MRGVRSSALQRGGVHGGAVPSVGAVFVVISCGWLFDTISRPLPCYCRCTVAAEGPHSFQHNCSLPVVQTDRSPMRGARSEEPGALGGFSVAHPYHPAQVNTHVQRSCHG
jgi:hypothetical protein